MEKIDDWCYSISFIELDYEVSKTTNDLSWPHSQLFPLFSLLYSSCMMYHVFIMFLWCLFIDELHDDNSSHVFTTVFIMYDISCIHHVSTVCIHR